MTKDRILSRRLTLEEMAEICNFVDNFLAAHRYAPTLDELGTEFGWKSRSSAWDFVKQIENLGWMDHISGQNRTVHTTDKYRSQGK